MIELLDLLAMAIGYGAGVLACAYRNVKIKPESDAFPVWGFFGGLAAVWLWRNVVL